MHGADDSAVGTEEELLSEEASGVHAVPRQRELGEDVARGRALVDPSDPAVLEVHHARDARVLRDEDHRVVVGVAFAQRGGDR